MVYQSVSSIRSGKSKFEQTSPVSRNVIRRALSVHSPSVPRQFTHTSPSPVRRPLRVEQGIICPKYRNKKCCALPPGPPALRGARHGGCTANWSERSPFRRTQDSRNEKRTTGICLPSVLFMERITGLSGRYLREQVSRAPARRPPATPKSSARRRRPGTARIGRAGTGP